MRIIYEKYGIIVIDFYNFEEWQEYEDITRLFIIFLSFWTLSTFLYDRVALRPHKPRPAIICKVAYQHKFT